MFIALLTITKKKWKHLNVLHLFDACRNCSTFMHWTTYRWAIKTNKLLIHAVTWVDLKFIML